MGQQQQQYDERRQSQRIELEVEKICLSWTDMQGNIRTDDANCIDISRNGILIEYTQPFVLGDILEITFNPNSTIQHNVSGQVCRCLESENHYNYYQIALQII